MYLEELDTTLISEHFEYLCRNHMFTNLNRDGPSFGLRVPKRSRQWSEIGLGIPFRDAAGNLSIYCWEINNQPNLLQAAFDLKLNHVKWIFWSGRSIKANSETQEWLAIWIVEPTPAHHAPLTKLQDRGVRSRIPLFLCSLKVHRYKRANKRSQTLGWTDWQKVRKFHIQA